MSGFSKGLLASLLGLGLAACSAAPERPVVRTPPPATVTPDPTTAVPAPGAAERPAPGPRIVAPAVTAPPPGGPIPRQVGRDITPADPLRLMVIGDSLADGFGIFMPHRVQKRGLPVTVINRGKTSTGLARKDFYNWPDNFAAMAAELRPDVVVVHFGANDDKPMTYPDGRTIPYNTPEWDAAYRAELKRILAAAGQYGAVVYVLGPAPDRDPGRNALLTRLNPLFRDEAARAGAYFISLPAFAAGPGGAFARVVNGTEIRTGDGSHFNVTGYYLVADNILAAIERHNPGIFAPPQEVADLR